MSVCQEREFEVPEEEDALERAVDVVPWAGDGDCSSVTLHANPLLFLLYHHHQLLHVHGLNVNRLLFTYHSTI